MERAAFFADMKSDATLFYIVRMAESAARVPQEIQDANLHIRWRDLIGARDSVIPKYGPIRADEDAVWEIIQSVVPDLLPKLRELVESE